VEVRWHFMQGWRFRPHRGGAGLRLFREDGFGFGSWLIITEPQMAWRAQEIAQIVPAKTRETCESSV